MLRVIKDELSTDIQKQRMRVRESEIPLQIVKSKIVTAMIKLLHDARERFAK